MFTFTAKDTKLQQNHPSGATRFLVFIIGFLLQQKHSFSRAEQARQKWRNHSKAKHITHISLRAASFAHPTEAVGLGTGTVTLRYAKHDAMDFIMQFFAWRAGRLGAKEAIFKRILHLDILYFLIV